MYEGHVISEIHLFTEKKKHRYKNRILEIFKIAALTLTT